MIPDKEELKTVIDNDPDCIIMLTGTKTDGDMIVEVNVEAPGNDFIKMITTVMRTFPDMAVLFKMAVREHTMSEMKKKSELNGNRKNNI